MTSGPVAVARTNIHAVADHIVAVAAAAEVEQRDCCRRTVVDEMGIAVVTERTQHVVALLLHPCRVNEKNKEHKSRIRHTVIKSSQTRNGMNLPFDRKSRNARFVCQIPH
jgi:hypothetical protein